MLRCRQLLFSELVQQFYHALEIGTVANVVSTRALSHSRQNKENCFG